MRGAGRGPPGDGEHLQGAAVSIMEQTPQRVGRTLAEKKREFLRRLVRYRMEDFYSNIAEDNIDMFVREIDEEFCDWVIRNVKANF